MSLRSSVRGSLPYAVAVIGGFLIAYLIVAFLIFPSGVIPGNARVPNVTGLPFPDAAKRLSAVGFKAQRGEPRFHASSPKETVLEQEPRAGTRDVDGATVTLVVSAGQQLVAVPAIVGHTQVDAQTMLEDAGFEVGQIIEKPNAAPRGRVLESQPAPGTKASVPSAVAITVSSGTPPTGK